MTAQNCPLCNSLSHKFAEHRGRKYFSCPLCNGIFMDRYNLPSTQAEISRYDEHNNDVNDTGYQKFVQPIVKAVTVDFKKTDIGLDFGAGRGPVISRILTDQGYPIEQFDPFYKNDESSLNINYNYVVCCEVVEHFHNPDKEFLLLKSLLKDKGKLYIKTSLYSPDIDFEKWYYKNDLTHVFFYQKETMLFIKNKYEFSDLEFADGIIILTRQVYT